MKGQQGAVKSMDSRDPFNGLNVEEIANLPDDRYRYYVAHKLAKMDTTLNILMKRPTRTLSKLAILSGMIATGCSVIAVIIAMG